PPHWSRFIRLVATREARGTSVMQGPDGKPLLVLSREGEGRVALLLSDHIWLWARGFEGGGPHLDLLRRLSHWLMKQPDLEEEALRLSVQGKQLLVRRQTTAEGGDNVARVLAVRSTDTFKGDDWIGVKMRDASVVRGIGVLPVFAGLIGLLLLVGSLAATWAREGR